jgi:hypothetical protein
MPKPDRNIRKPSNRSFDAESRKPRVTTRRMFSKQPPIESDSESSDNQIESDVDSEIENITHLTVKDDTRKKILQDEKPRKRKEKDTATQEAIHSKAETASAEQLISSAPHMIMRSAVYHMRIAPITFPQVSTYIPSFYMFFFALNSAHQIVHENTYLRYLTPQYITIASTLYYAILGYIQVLRAKTIAGIITRSESQALRRFEREFAFESLPIMSPLIMFFQNLGAAKISDPMYSWICPTIPDTIGTGANEDGIFARSTDIMLPNVPALIRFLYEIGSAATVAAITSTSNQIVPASAVAGNTNFFGINLAAGNINTGNNQRLLYSAGWLVPPEIPESLDLKVIRRIGRWNLPGLSNASDLRSIGQFLQTDGNMEWFKSLINLTTEEARFFKGSTNLGAIVPQAGLPSLIECKLDNHTSPTATDVIFPFSDANFSSDIWKFVVNTTRGETTADENRIGSTTQFIITDFGLLTPPNHHRPAPEIRGPYFGQPATARQVFQHESDTTRTPRSAFEQIIRENLYDETGGQSGRL